jgi:hypothetical protein
MHEEGSLKAQERRQPICFQLDWTEPRGFGRAIEPASPRWLTWIQVILATLVVLVGLGLAGMKFFGNLFFSELAVIVTITLGTGVFCLLAIPIVLLFAARVLSYHVALGPKGISRTQTIPLGGFHAIVRGWTVPWQEVEGLVCVEDFPLGQRVWKVLVVRTLDGQQRLAGIADEVGRERLAATVTGWGQRLEVTSLGEENVQTQD